MKALVLEATDAAPVYRDADTPEPGAGQARVRLRAAALNRRDVYIQRGQYPGIRHPIILGSDGCGAVDAVGAGVDGGWVGRRVVLDPSVAWGDDPRKPGDAFRILGLPEDGTFAEHIVIPAENLHRAPEHLDDVQAAALPLAGVTAWRALMTRAGLRSGERVLVTGVGGGVAVITTQLAAAAGADVWVTSSSEAKIARAVELGAKGGRLYTEDAWRKALRKDALGDFDVIIDSAGGEGFGELVRLLAPAGRLAFFGGTRGKWPPILPQHLFFRQISILASTMGSPMDFAALLDFVRTHRITPVVDETFPLADGAAAFEHLDAGGHMGKVALAID